MSSPYELPTGRRDAVYEVAQTGIGVAYFILLLFMPLSRAVEQSTGLIALGLLIISYLLRPQRAAIRAFPWRWAYAAVLVYFLLNCFVSVAPWLSLKVLRQASHIGFLLLLSGLEIGRRPGLLRIFPWVLAILAFYQGVAGVWQSIVGFDPIHGTPVLGVRLTGAFSNYRVGDLLALALAANLSLPFVMPRSWSVAKRAAICAVLWLPALYTFIFAQTRCGYICLAVALAAFYALHKGISWRWVTPVLVAAIMMGIVGVGRVDFAAVPHDGRLLELWPLGWKMFLQHPILGVGVGAYEAAYRGAGITLQLHATPSNHPHNIYLQLLCETGVIGFILFCLFLGLTMYWGWRTLRKHRLSATTPADRLVWKVAAACWSATAGYAAMALFAHSLFRTWWLALAFSFLGIMAGACLFLRGKR